MGLCVYFYLSDLWVCVMIDRYKMICDVSGGAQRNLIHIRYKILFYKIAFLHMFNLFMEKIMPR